MFYSSLEKGPSEREGLDDLGAAKSRTERSPNRVVGRLRVRDLPLIWVPEGEAPRKGVGGRLGSWTGGDG